MVLGLQQELGEGNGDVVAAGTVGVAVLLEVLVGSLVGENLN